MILWRLLAVHCGHRSREQQIWGHRHLAPSACPHTPTIRNSEPQLNGFIQSAHDATATQNACACVCLHTARVFNNNVHAAVGGGCGSKGPTSIWGTARTCHRISSIRLLMMAGRGDAFCIGSFNLAATCHPATGWWPFCGCAGVTL